MRQYPEAHKKAVVSKLMKSGLSLRQFAQREGISQSTLHSWRRKYAEAGLNLTKNSDPDDWSTARSL
ncbi:MAG: IS66 family insertion sequence element accessory protein TnpA [Enterovibrio sp.]